MRNLYPGERFDITNKQFLQSQLFLMKEEVFPKKYKYDELTDYEKKDIIEVDGKKYVRKIYEMRYGIVEREVC